MCAGSLVRWLVYDAPMTARGWVLVVSAVAAIGCTDDVQTVCGLECGGEVRCSNGVNGEAEPWEGTCRFNAPDGMRAVLSCDRKLTITYANGISERGDWFGEGGEVTLVIGAQSVTCDVNWEPDTPSNNDTSGTSDAGTVVRDASTLGDF